MDVNVWRLILAGGVAFLVLLAGLLSIGMFSGGARRSPARLRGHLLALVDGLLDRDFSRALDVLQRLLAEEHAPADLTLLLTRIQTEAGQRKRATEVLQNLLMRPELDKALRSRILTSLAALLREAGHPDQAAQALEHAVALSKGDAEAHRELSLARADQGRFDDARRALSRCEKLTGADDPAAHGELWLREGRLRLENDDLKGTRSVLRAARRHADTAGVQLLGFLLAAAEGDRDEQAIHAVAVAGNPRAGVAHLAPLYAQLCAHASGSDASRRTAQIQTADALAARMASHPQDVAAAALLTLLRSSLSDTDASRAPELLTLARAVGLADDHKPV